MKMNELKWINFDKLDTYKELLDAPKTDIKAIMTGEGAGKRVAEYQVDMPCGYKFNYACRPVNCEVLSILKKMAEEAQLIEKYNALLSGERINNSENRAVLHQLTRGYVNSENIVDIDGDKGEFYKGEFNKIADFSKKIRDGEIKAADGKCYTDVIQIGIGGSDLGPRAMYLALENWAKRNGIKTLKAHFVSNVDPDDAAAVFASVDLAHTLVIVVSKSGTTLETLTNELFADSKLENAGLDPKKQIVVCTSETSKMAAEAKEGKYLAAFYMDDFIGGRYSSSSVVGGVVLSLAYGADTFASFMEGAHKADVAAAEPDPFKNAAMLDALIGVYERNILGYPVTAVLPYSQALIRFAAHLQQLDMESNGKCVNRFGKRIAYKTGPILFGEPGTNGQHSFYQLLHQGTDITPMQFIGYKNSQLGDDISLGTAMGIKQDSTSQEKLNANLAAQIIAFSCGKEDDRDGNLNDNFEGGRPSSLIAGNDLNPETLGCLLGHFENKVMFQGFLWNLNSFDQPGVQLGKKLAMKVLNRAFTDGTDDALKAYCALLGIED